MPPARALFWAATLGGIVLTARSVFAAPPPLWVALVGIHVYLAILLSGVFVLRLRMFVDAVVEGPDDARGVVLTFDDGPDPEHTREVLDVLDEHDAKATFFVIGKKAEAHPELVKEIVERGHDVGVHSYAHDRLFALRGTKRVRADLNRAIVVLEAILGRTPDLWRPPIGHTNPTIARVADQLDLVTVGWSVGARDGIKAAKPAAVLARVSRGLRDGAIVLLHDASERGTHKPAGVVALREILERVRSQNLTVTPLRSWLDDGDAGAGETPELSR